MFLGHGHADSEGHSHGSQQSTDSINYQSHINQAFEEYQRAREESRARNDSYAARQRIPPITVTSSGDNRTILFTSYKSPEPVALPSLPRYQGTYTSNHSGDHFMPTEAHRRPLAARVISGLISIAAFAVHEIFDGVTIGVQQSPTRIWTIFGAIATHKAVMAFAVGTSVHEQAVTMTLTSVLLLFYAILTPVGILVLIFAQQALERESLAVIILQSFSIGTIIYVVFYELLRVKDATGKLLTMSLYFSMIAGFAAMTCLTLFVVDE
ncbi:Zinc transporter ZIP3 [Halotydeus destructor]|nr:Zinc transporter ZIP3 [Halotydeus destructor]